MSKYLELAEESRYNQYCDSKLISPGTRNKWNFCVNLELNIETLSLRGKGKVGGWHSRLYVWAKLGGGTAYSQLYAWHSQLYGGVPQDYTVISWD